MRKISYITKSLKETKALGAILGGELRGARRQKQAFVIALSGELGAGKTLFTQGLTRALGVRSRVQSPTFVLMRRYSLRRGGFKNLWHIDCYRVKRARELVSIGLTSIMRDSTNIIVIEWAERIKKYIPKSALWIYFDHKARDERIISFRS